MPGDVSEPAGQQGVPGYQERRQQSPQEPAVVAATESEEQAAAAPPPPPPAASAARRSSGPAPLLALAALAVSAGTAAFLLLRRLRRGSSRVQWAPVAKHQVFSAVLALNTPSVPLPPPAGAALEGRTLVLSDRLDVQSLETRFGCEPWKQGRQPAERTYPPADALVAAGACGAATVLGGPLGLGPLLSLDGAGTPNPAGQGRTHGGGDYGAAVAVAGGLADLALAVDELGSARVPAACCGAYALRTSAGVLPLEGASTASHSLAAPALLAADPAALLRAGAALRLPGGGAATEVFNYLVAEDFFAACGEEARAMVPAVVAAVKRWAGPDQAQALSLCEWLYHRVEPLRAFMAQEGTQEEGAATAGRQQRSEGVLQALAAVAEAVRGWEFCQKYGAWVEAHQGQLAPTVVEFWQQAQQMDEARYRAAQAVASELQAGMRDALRDGYIFVLPTTPGSAPPTATAASQSSQDGSASAAAVFRERCIQFSAVAALSGVPQVVLPLPLPGGMPLSVSLLALHKRDLALLQAAAKLGPMLAEEAATLAAQRQQERRSSRRGGGEAPRWQPQAAAAAEPSAVGSSGSQARGKGNSSGGKRGSKPGSSSGAADPAQAVAEARKEDGNAAFRAGRYEEAVRHYSAAAQLYPRCAVYYANRAMAYLKLGSYGAAEADCDEALKLELSAKALLRRASARLAQGNAEGAKADFRQVLALEPQNKQAREELRGIEALEGLAGGGALGELAAAGAWA